MDDWRLPERFDWAGDQVAFCVMGTGPALVLVHGFPGNSFTWREVAPALAQRFEVHVLDMLGFGASTQRPGLAVSARAQAAMLAGLIAHRDLETPLVAAHDIGSAVALGAALFHGARYRRLALIDAATLNPCVSRNSLHVQAHLDAYRTMPAPIYEHILRAHIPTAMAAPMPEAVFEGYYAPWRGERGQAAYFDFLGQFDTAFLDEIEHALPRLDLPVRVLWGERDTWIPASHGERLARLLPDASLVMLRDAGHFAMDDAPDAVTRELLAFFTAEPPAVA